jgi:predicted ester cyclase
MTDTNHHVASIVFDNRDIARYGEGGQRMPMRGFEDQYTDIVDYIIRITHRIWEEKAVGYIYNTYQHNCVVHAGNTDVHGREDVVAGTLQFLSAIPDRKLYGEDVIWSGNENDGYHTSHLIMSVGHNTGWSAYGPPTGRKAVWRAIANCVVRDNLIFEEWLLRDETALIRQLGFDPWLVAETQVRGTIGAGLQPEPVGEIGRTRGQFPPPVMPAPPNGAFDVEDFVRRAYHEIWNWRLLNTIRDRYTPSHVCTNAGGRKLHGQDELTTFVLSMLSMFPDAGVTVDHVYWNGDDQAGYRVAVRWTFTGTHTGIGFYGPPTGARVHIMGLSQHHIRNGLFTKEYTLFDEMGLIKQLVAKRLAATVDG